MNNSGAAGPSSFFRIHSKSFIRFVDLDVIIPGLNGECLLTDVEHEIVTHQPDIATKRKCNLADILYRKPARVPWVVLKCLKDSYPHDNHMLLAGELESYLQQWPEGPQQFQPTRCTIDSIRIPEEQHRIDALSDLHTSNQQYFDLLRAISSELNQQGFGREHIVRILGSICGDCNLVRSLPITVTDFPSFVVFLHERGLCHEYDTDFLCKVLSLLPAEELRKRVVAYSNSLQGINVLQHSLRQSASPSSDHFLAFTFHSLPSMTLGQALGVKDFLAAYLGVPRCSFSLKRAGKGSVVLIWQFPTNALKQLSMCCGEDKLRSILDSEEKVEVAKIEKVVLEFQVHDEVEEKVVFSRILKRKRRRSDEISSTTEEESPAKVMKTDQREPVYRGMQ